MRLSILGLFNGLLALLTLVVSVQSSTVAVAQDAGPTVSVSADEMQILALLNGERARAGQPPLVLQPQLIAAAQLHSSNVARTGIFSHNGVAGPDDDMRSRVMGTGITWFSTLGENISMAANTDDAVNGWMNSQGHRDNILSPRFGRVGIAVRQAANGIRYWTTVFSDAAELEGSRGQIILPNGNRLDESGRAISSNGQPAPDNGSGEVKQPIDLTPRVETEVVSVQFASLQLTNMTPVTLEICTLSNGLVTVLNSIASQQQGLMVMPLGSEYLIRVQGSGQIAIRTTLTKDENFTIGQQ
jgi:uncharacterized protein YkwD